LERAKILKEYIIENTEIRYHLFNIVDPERIHVIEYNHAVTDVSRNLSRNLYLFGWWNGYIFLPY
jgi:hypothetical protein